VRCLEAEDIVKELEEKGFLISPRTLKLILNAENPREVADKLIEQADGFVIDVAELESLEKTKVESKKEVIVEKTLFHAIAKDIEADIKLIEKEVQTGEGTVEDFVQYFRNRYEKISAMLRKRAVPITRLLDVREKSNGKVRVIGMLSEKRLTKNGHVFIRLEDLVTSINALVPANNRELIAKAERLMLDEVAAFDGRMSNGLFIINEIIEPDIESMRTVKTIDDDIIFAMLSDLHIGSKLFMKDNFGHMLNWLKGRVGSEKDKQIASRVKYITIAGDICDGIGIYPGQENELEITDIYKQYEVLEQYLVEEIPEYIHVVLIPGNHDAVRNADPQPKLPKELVPRLYEAENVHLLGSPGWAELHGFKLLLYHGTSLADFVSQLPHVTFEKPELFMEEALKKRHVHPYFGGKPVIPQNEDIMVIEETPDIFHTGEAHHNAYCVYRGTVCISSGTWQETTEYQTKQGHKATPAILPIFEAKTGRIKSIHFDREFSVEVVK